jgi:hypothetical protein
VSHLVSSTVEWDLTPVARNPTQKEALMHTRLITLSSRSLVFLSLLAACEDMTKPAAPPDPSLSVGLVRDHFTFPIDLTFDCTAAGGEVIDVSGTAVQNVTIVLHEDGSFNATIATAGQGLTGIGQSTGATYQVPGMGLTNLTSQVQQVGETFVMTFLDLTHLVRTGPGGDGTLWGAKFVQHLTITSTGQVIDNVFDATDCVQL